MALAVAGSGGGWLVAILLVVVASIVVLVAALRARRARSAEPPALSPEDQLHYRFIRGEIEEDEYLRRRDALRWSR